MDNEPEMKFYVEGKPFYKKIPVIGVIVLLLLIGAWVFRWDYKMTQTYSDDYNNGKIVHKIDRWTGNHWYELYGWFRSGYNWEMYSGKEAACLKNGVKAEGEQIDAIRHRRTGTTVIWCGYVGIYCL